MSDEINITTEYEDNNEFTNIDLTDPQNFRKVNVANHI